MEQREVSGESRGLIPPHLTLLGLVCAMIAVLVSSPLTPTGISWMILTVLLWALFFGTGLKDLLVFTGALLLLFLPLFLITWGVKILSLQGSLPERLWIAAAVPASLVSRGLMLSLLTVTTLKRLSEAELHEGLCRVPGPPVLAALMTGIVFQIRSLSGETTRMMQSIRVRGHKKSAFYSMITALPTVWLPRVLFRSHRLSDAMTVRGLETTAVPFQRYGFSLRALLTSALFLLWASVSVVLRVML
ncbi:hypothetical protein KKF84_21380 [Myxococcota bacterium]|nr:hypothetical protein [Myxococcota bacterium]MBU1537879.1 hypothetical protein [Myxococcota bacterium]